MSGSVEGVRLGFPISGLLETGMSSCRPKSMDWKYTIRERERGFGSNKIVGAEGELRLVK